MKALESFLNFFMNLVFETHGLAAAAIVLLCARFGTHKEGPAPDVLSKIKWVAISYLGCTAFIFFSASLLETIKRGNLSGDLLVPLIFVVSSLYAIVGLAAAWVVFPLFMRARPHG